MIKSIKFILLATAGLAIALTIQQQSVAAFNDVNPGVQNIHDHNGAVGGFVLNAPGFHSNQNCNLKSPARAGDPCQSNTQTH
jgi:hypothetical protein